MNFLVSALITIIFFLNKILAAPELKLLNVVFRHGDRTPTVNALFPNDPYYKFNFYPYGPGALTNIGKLRSYKLGEFLRRRYKDFLGDVYLPEQLYARSTDYDRTKMSLQLVLAALFPPSLAQKWHDTIDWQPIPFSYESKTDDELLGSIYQPEFQFERKRVEKTQDIQERLKNLRSFMSDLSTYTGRNISDSFDVKRIYDTLISESYMNLTLPEWSEKIFPYGHLLEGILLDYDIVSYDNIITSVLAGKLMTKITSDMIAATDITKFDRQTKLYLYSGHEINIVGVLKSLKVYETHIPQYTSAVIIELLEDFGKYYVKVLYYRGIPEEVTELQLPGCPFISPCPFEQYLANVNDILDIVKNYHKITE